MDDAVRALFAAGRAAWPTVTLDEPTFAAWIAERGDPATLHGGELFLACACAQGDRAALEAFDKRYIADVPSFLARTSPTPALVDDVRQQLRERLFVSVDGKRPKICEYSGRGTLGSWLRVVALRTASNLRRSDKGHEELRDETGAPDVLPRVDPELALMRTKYGAAFHAAFADAFQGLSAQQRSLFRLHYLDGLNIERIGAVFSVSRATVGRMMIAAREQLLEDTLALLQERLRVSVAELQSLLGLVRSQLEVSLRTLLAASGSTPAG
jgi:RNA polymerase sigma-70 factor (ECF subfamily)